MRKKEDKHYCQKEAELAALKTNHQEIKGDIKEIKKALLGNGRQGILADINQAKGAVGMFKFLAGGGIIFSIVALSISIWQMMT